MYNLNVYILMQQVLPEFLRKNKLLTWMWVLMLPVQYIADQLYTFTTAKLRDARYTNQTASMEAMLNQYWPSGNGGIWIDNSPVQLPINYMFRTAEQQPALEIRRANEVVQTPTIIYRTQEYAAAYSFIVWVPDITIYTEAQMRARIDLYRAAGRRYIIKTYTL